MWRFPLCFTRAEDDDRGRDETRHPSQQRERYNHSTAAVGRRTRSAPSICRFLPLPCLYPPRRRYLHYCIPSPRWNPLFFCSARLHTHQDADFLQEQASRCNVRVERLPGAEHDTCGLHVHRTGARTMEYYLMPECQQNVDRRSLAAWCQLSRWHVSIIAGRLRS